MNLFPQVIIQEEVVVLRVSKFQELSKLETFHGNKWKFMGIMQEFTKLKVGP